MKKKKQEKTKEEKVAEGYFPVEERDLQHAVEKPIKEPLPAQSIIKTAVEKEYKSKRKPTKKKSSSKTKKSLRGGRATPSRVGKGSTSRTKKEYKPSKISLKKDGYELIITEKPQAALKIATALGTSTEKKSKGVKYYEVKKGNKKIIVGCAVGHLFSLAQQKRGQVPAFDIEWTPNFIVRKKDFTKKYFDTLVSLAKKAGSLTVATDYDVEGEVIGLNVVRLLCQQKDANRMKFSTLTPKELQEAYEKKSKTINWNQAIAGETRHYLDWYYGINLSRALMNSISSTGRFKIMSIGRVQGPALNLIVQKEREIQKFKPTPYWQVFIETEQGKTKLELKHNKDITKKNELDKFKKLKGKTAEAKLKKTEQKIPPLAPFNLTTLQTESYRLFGITPSRTLQIAQSLYLSGIISYPRTSSQKLPDSINYKEILQKLSKQFKVQKLITKTKPVEGKKSDPAHPSIYPTAQTGTMSTDEEKIYKLIVKRFLSLFCDEAIVDNKTISVEIDKLKFSTKGSSIRKKSWMEIYPTKVNEKEVPDVSGEVKITKVKTEEKETQPPKRYSPASIVSELEKRNLGTKATRASILETLYDRNYVKEKSIEATPIGMSLISTLEKYSPVIIDEKLTRYFEKEMDLIQQLKKNHTEKQKKIIDEAKKSITKIMEQFSKNKEKVGKELVKATDNLIKQEREENKLNQCPECKKGNLQIRYAKQFRRYFAGCSNYPNCKKTYTLPPNGMIKRTEKVCEECGFPKLMRLSKGRRPWEFCFNPECKTNKERMEKYKEKKEEEN